MKFIFIFGLMVASSAVLATELDNRMLVTGNFVVDALANVNTSPNECGRPVQIQCSQKYLTDLTNPNSVCSEWNRGPINFLQTFADSSVVVNPLAIDRVMMKGAEKTPENNQLRELFSTVNPNPVIAQKRDEALEMLKRVLREQITQGRPEEELNDNQKFLLFKLNSLNVSYNYDEGCEGYPYNASYSGVFNTLNICPLLTHMPVESYLSLLGHELGHMADPCFSFMDLYPFSPSIAALRENPEQQKELLTQQINSCLTGVSEEERTQFVNWATAFSRMENQGFNIYAREDDSRRSLVVRLAGCGVVSTPPVLSPRTYEGNPYLPIIACVGNRHLDQQRTINNETHIQEGTQGESCDRSTVMSETIADYVASSVISRMLINYPDIVPRERRSLLPMFYNGVQCSPPNGDNAYLDRNSRMNLFLDNPIIQETLGCDGSTLASMCPIPTSLSGVP